MNKKKLYESIMDNVAKELKKALNEDFQFDDTEVADKLLELVKKDKQIQNIVKNANPDDWANVLRGMGRLIKGKKIGENPVKIANIIQLANAILNRCDKTIQDKLPEMQNEDIQYTANFLAKEVRNAYGEQKGKQPEQASQSKNEGKECKEGKVCDKCGKNPCQCEGKECGESCGENKKVQEARNFNAGRFTKFLNENNIRPGKK